MTQALKVISDELEIGIGLALELSSCRNDATLEAMAAWMKANPALIEELFLAARAWDELAEISADEEMVAWREQALRSVQSNRKSTWLRYAMAAGATVVSLASLWFFQFADTGETRVYATAVGERARIRLADGSSVDLDDSSSITVDFTGPTRNVSLDKGQANFIVTHDDERPFLVSAGAQQVRAVGTVFNIDTVDHLTVSLIEGSISVSPIETSTDWLGRTTHNKINSSSIKMKAGQSLVVENSGRRRLNDIDPEEVLAWQQGKIVIKNDDLISAAQKINRYSTRKITILSADGDTATMSGIFQSGDPNSFVDAALTFFPRLKIKEEGADKIILADE